MEVFTAPQQFVRVIAVVNCDGVFRWFDPKVTEAKLQHFPQYPHSHPSGFPINPLESAPLVVIPMSGNFSGATSAMRLSFRYCIVETVVIDTSNVIYLYLIHCLL